MYEQLIIWTVLTLVPLIPTYVTHKFLKSSAAYQTTHTGIKLGGAIASYFVLVTTAFTTYNHMFNDPLSEIREAMSGDFSCVSTVSETDEDWVGVTINTSMSIHVNGGGKVSVTGHADRNNTFWTAEEVIVTHEKLIVIFNAPVSRATGIIWLTFQKQDSGDIDALFGNWVITGSTGRGSISCFRDEPMENYNR